MRRLFSLFMVLATVGVAAAPGCTTVTCGVGTIERNGECAPADGIADPASCGSGTVLVGDRCVTTVECDSNTTKPVMNPDGSISCVGINDKSPCGVPISCPAPSTGKQTICGQLYDITDNSPFQASDGDGTRCDLATPTADGPCSLRMDAFNAVDFAGDPMGATPLNVGDKYLDNCGRYKFIDVTPPAAPFIGLGFDDAAAADAGPPGLTNAVGAALASNPDSSTDNFEAFIAPKATTDMWANGGPTVATGFHVLIFRKHKCDANGTCTGDRFAAQSGVQIYKGAQAVPNSDTYFEASDTGHTMIDAGATSTGMNGTGLLTGATTIDGLVWTGMGGITDTTSCTWEQHAAASIPGVVTFQIYRPTDQLGHTCNQ
jgi:hypothetical protein